jgi:hypothetical protein
MDVRGRGKPGERSTGRNLILALALASALPCAALAWPGAVPRQIVVLSLVAWAGIFAVALWSAWVEDRRRRLGTRARRRSDSTPEAEAGRPSPTKP